MLNPRALWPFPNAILWNWATIFILAFGNLAAIDFQARCMAARTAKIATAANIIAGCLGIFVGVPFAFIGGVSRFYYGADSKHAKFEADTCSRSIDFPTCAQWLPDPKANLRLLTHEVPNWLGAWTLIGIVAASMSTSDGAILAMSTVHLSSVSSGVACASVSVLHNTQCRSRRTTFFAAYRNFSQQSHLKLSRTRTYSSSRASSVCPALLSLFLLALSPGGTLDIYSSLPLILSLPAASSPSSAHSTLRTHRQMLASLP